MAATATTKKWKNVRGTLSPAREAKAKARSEALRKEWRLAEIRKALSLTQETVAEAMQVAQGEVSKIENREDLYLSTIDELFKALGAELVIVARFKDRDLEVSMGDARMRTIKMQCPTCKNQTRISYTPGDGRNTEQWACPECETVHDITVEGHSVVAVASVSRRAFARA
jgi:transcriptional regulator with XRE-family HTH domain